MNKEKLKIILEKHKLWLDNKNGGVKADLIGVASIDVGKFKAKNLHLNFWNGKKIQEINNKTFNLEAIND